MGNSSASQGTPMDSIRLCFDKKTHPSAIDRVNAYRDAMSASADIEVRPEEIEPFQARLDYHRLGSVLLVDLNATRHTIVRRASTRSRAPFDHVLVDLFAAGGMLLRAGNTAINVAAGDCVMLDFNATWRAEAEAGVRFLGAVIPRELFDDRTGAVLAVHGRVFRAGSREACLIAPLMETLSKQAPHLREPLASAAGHSLISLIGACAVAQGASILPGRSPRPVASLASLRLYIDRHAAEPDLGPARLCEDFGLSRSALYRLFKPSGGIAEAIRRRRAALALQMLREQGGTSRSLDEIARASGFPDGRTLRRSFLEVYQALPTEIRKTTPKQPGATRHAQAISALLNKI